MMVDRERKLPGGCTWRQATRKMRHTASQPDSCHLFMHLHVFVSLLHMKVKSTWIMYLPRQHWCFLISHQRTGVISLLIYNFCPPFSITLSLLQAPVSLHLSTRSPLPCLPHHGLITLICGRKFALTSLKRQLARRVRLVVDLRMMITQLLYLILTTLGVRRSVLSLK